MLRTPVGLALGAIVVLGALVCLVAFAKAVGLCCEKVAR